MVSTRNCKFESRLSKKSCRMEEEKDQTLLLDLPCDLLQLIASCLPLKDNIRASTACKTWHRACVAARVADIPPWLIYSSETEESYEFYDPSSQKTYKLEFPELSGFRFCYSKDGWLLMYNSNSLQVLFFNPFTRDTIPAPSLHMEDGQRIAFSCAPTSASCLLFTFSKVDSGVITMNKCCPNAQEWETVVIESQFRGYRYFSQIVFSNGVFYCLAQTGCLSIFDPALNSWTDFPGLTLDIIFSHTSFMTEYQGEIFVINADFNRTTRVLKLDHKSWSWTERKTLGGLTIYASALSSVLIAEQKKLSGIRNCLSSVLIAEQKILSGIRNCYCLSLLKRRCIYYIVGNPKERIHLRCKSQRIENIWIVPPLNVLDLPLFAE